MDYNQEEMLDTLKEHLDGFLPALGMFAADITLTKEINIKKMQSIFESIEGISKLIEGTKELTNIQMDEYPIVNTLQSLMEAVEAKDGVATADILEYEIIPLLVTIQEKL